MLTRPADLGEHGHLARIDVLRGVAILLVVAFHAFGAAFGQDTVDWAGVLAGREARPAWSFALLYPLHFGCTGVSLFFVISGYVIHRSFMRAEGSFSWGGYAARRFWRIYPAYVVVLVALAAWGRGLGSRDFAAHAMMAHNVSARTFYTINPSFWSLAVEAQLYALYPIAIALRRFWGPRGMLVAAAVAALAWRVGVAALTGWPGDDNAHLWSGAAALWPEWLLGAYVAERHAAGARAARRSWPWVAGGVLVLLAGEVWEPASTVQSAGAAVAYAALLDAYVRGGLGERRRGRLARWVAAVGLCSYSLYLIHQPLMRPFAAWVAGLGLRSPVGQLALAFPVYIAAAVGCSWVMYVMVERGGMRVGRRLMREGRAGARAPLAVAGEQRAS